MPDKPAINTFRDLLGNYADAVKRPGVSPEVSVAIVDARMALEAWIFAGQPTKSHCQVCPACGRSTVRTILPGPKPETSYLQCVACYWVEGGKE